VRVLYINGKFASQATTGVQRYAETLVSSWDADLAEGKIDSSKFSIRLVVPKTDRPLPQYRHIEIIRSRLNGKLWEQFELPCRSRGSLLFSPYAAAPLLKKRHIVTIHDAGVAATPEQYSFLFRSYYRFVYWFLGRFCLTLLTVSEFSRNELHRFFSIPLAKLTAIPPGSDYLMRFASDTSILDRFGLTSRKFVLGVSSQSPIKNFTGLAEAWKLLDLPTIKLAIAGGTNSRVFGVKGIDLQEGIVKLGYVSDSELRALYEHAAVFVYPSFYEGFGLPPVEAMFCSCPVIAANSSALPETCADAVIYCNPNDSQEIASRIEQVLRDSHLACDLREKGVARARKFETRAAATRIWNEIAKYV
jgi:glycosyltransferase involved in cell wall biosynthesis